MLSYKNVYEKTHKYSDSKQRFSIHCVGLVTVSVLVGLVCQNWQPVNVKKTKFNS